MSEVQEEQIVNLENNEIESNALSHQENCIRDLERMFNYHLSKKDYKKIHLLSYWFQDFSRYNIYEENFNPRNLKRYKRGDVIKANLGFNIGNEVGGLHYCVVLDKNNSLSSGTLTIVPLTSIKENKEYHSSTVNMGNEIYKNLQKKHDESLIDFTRRFNSLNKSLTQKGNTINLPDSELEGQLLILKQLTIDMEYLKKMEKEIDKMKKGSIALVHQITTISKQRIYNPQNKNDILSGVKISPESLDLIDDKIKKLFLRKI